MNNASTLNVKQANELISLSEREALLRAQPGFSELTISDMARLVGCMFEINVPAGERIVTEGDLIDAVYILASGSAEVTHEVLVNNKPGITLLATLHDGDSIGLKGGQFFSETGLRTATVTATSSCILLKLLLSDLKQFLESRPELMESLHTKSAWMLRMQMIKQAAPFAKLNNQQLAGLASNVKEIEFAENHVIFKQGDSAESCYLLTSGKVEISVKADDGKEQVVAILEPYSLLGEAAFLQYAKRNGTARTLSDCTLLLMDKDVLLELASNEEEVPDTLLMMIKGHCRPMRHDNIVYQHRETSDGQKITTLKDGSTNNYLQLTEEGWFIWTQMNGTLTLAELSKLLFKRFGQSNPDEVKRIVQQLVDAGFASIDAKDTISNGSKAGEEDSTSILSRLINFSFFLPKADKKIGFLYKHGGFALFTIPGLIAQLLILVAGLYFFSSNINTVMSNIKDYDNLAFWFVVVIVMSMIYQILSPLTKALAIKYFDHEIPQFGIIWKKIGPVGIVDTSDMWLSSAWPQIAVCFIGIFSNLVIASLLALYASYVGNTNSMIFSWLCALFIYFQTLRSLDPMLDLDGYELLCLIMDCPQLRDLSIKWLLRKSDPSKHHRQEVFFWIYTLVYLLIILSVIQLILNQLVQQITAFAAYKEWVLVGLMVLFLTEIILGIQHYKQANSSQNL